MKKLPLVSIFLVICASYLIVTVIDRIREAKAPVIVVGTSAVTPAGEWVPVPAQVYLDEELLGVTPLELNKADLKRLDLPEFEVLQSSPLGAHRDTWEIGGRGLHIAFQHDPDTKELHFKRIGTSPGEDLQHRGVRQMQTDTGAVAFDFIIPAEAL